jgi:hypothetical protein
MNWEHGDGSGGFVHQLIKSAIRRTMMGDMDRFVWLNIKNNTIFVMSGQPNRYSVSVETYTALTKLLLDAGCSCTIKNAKGQTPLGIDYCA